MTRFMTVILAAVMLIGCGDETGPIGTSLPDETAPPTDPSERAWTSAEPVGDTIDPSPVAISALLEVDGASIRLGYESGVAPCYVLDSVEVEEGPEEVTITILVGTTDPEAVCIQIAEFRSVTVELSEPLGERVIVDGATGETIS